MAFNDRSHIDIYGLHIRYFNGFFVYADGWNSQ